MDQLSKTSKLSLAIVSFMVGLVLCEIILAFISPQVYRRPPELWQFDDRLGWRHSPNATGHLVSPEFDVEIRINSKGLRGPEISLEKPIGVRRILVFGDSFAEGWGVSEENIFSSRLQECLSVRGGETEVLNFGVAGYGNDQAYLLFQEDGRQYQADDVILLFYGNDLWNNASRNGIGVERGRKPFYRPQRSGTLELGGVPVKRTVYWDESRYTGGTLGERLYRFFRIHSHLFGLLSKIFTEDIKAGKVSAYYEGLYGLDMKQKWNPVWELTGMILRDFSESVKSSGARFHLIYVPSIVQVEEQDWKKKKDLHGLVGDYNIDKPNLNLALISEKYEIFFLDLLPIFRLNETQKDFYFRDSHWNNEGHSLAARTVCGKLLENDTEMVPK